MVGVGGALFALLKEWCCGIIAEMSTPCTGIPNSFTAGDTVTFTEPGGQYPATAWTNTLWLSAVGSLASPTSVVATASGNDFLFTISKTVTAALLIENWRYSQIVTGGTSEAYTVKEGTIVVLPNLTAEQPATTAQTMVTLYQTVIAKLAATKNQSVNFNGQSYTMANVKMYRDELTYWKAQVISEQAAIDRLRGGKDTGRVQPRFEPTYQNYPPFGFPGNVSL